MGRRNGVALSCAAVMALGGLAGGCGGSDDKKAAAPAPDRSVQQDAQSKSDVRNVVTFVESCYVDAGSYEGCKLERDGTVGGIDSGLSASSLAHLTTTATATDYAVTAESASGDRFVMTKAGGGPVKRTCTPAGKGGCEAGGTW